MSRAKLMTGVAVAALGALAVTGTFMAGAISAALAGKTVLAAGLGTVAKVAFGMLAGLVPVMVVEIRRQEKAARFEPFRCPSCHRPMAVGEDHLCFGVLAGHGYQPQRTSTLTHAKPGNPPKGDTSAMRPADRRHG